MILNCSCEHMYQDRRYGKGKRVHNKLQGSKNVVDRYRCSVCRNERNS